MKTYVITKGGIARIMRCKDYTTAEKQISEWHPNDKAQVSSIRQISDADVPDATFKDAWRDTGSSIAHDMPKAIDIAKDVVREKRGPLFAENDLAINDALLDDDEAKKADVITQRDKLRDATKHPSLLAAKNPNELKAAITEALK